MLFQGIVRITVYDDNYMLFDAFGVEHNRVHPYMAVCHRSETSDAVRRLDFS